MNKVRVDLEKTRHVSIIGDTGYGKTRYVKRLVQHALESNPRLKVIVFGSRDESWNDLEHMGLITLYSMEETIKERLLMREYPKTKGETLVVVEDIWHVIQLLPEKEHEGVISMLHELLTRDNVRSIVTSLRPTDIYYPPILLELANTKIALRLEYEYDYEKFFGTQAYKNNNKLPTKRGESFIKLDLTHDPKFIPNSQEIRLK